MRLWDEKTVPDAAPKRDAAGEQDREDSNKSETPRRQPDELQIDFWNLVWMEEPEEKEQT